MNERKNEYMLETNPMTNRYRPFGPARERGTTLLIAVVLLLLLTVITLFGLNVGVLEQQTATNDQRAKMVQQVAEAGLNQGIEYFRLRPDQADVDADWERCEPDDESFPCGAEPDVARRGNMYRWVGGTVDVDGGGLSDFETRRLPLTQAFSQIDMRPGVAGGEFDVRYDVGVVMCRIQIPDTVSEAKQCTTDEDLMSPTAALTYVARGTIDSEGASATVVQTTSAFRLLANTPGAPPIVASGAIDFQGAMDIVTNPNSGGTGVPVSIWTRQDYDHTGASSTCHMDEFIRYGGGTVEYYPDTNVITCDDCSCDHDPKDCSLALSCKARDYDGPDVLDIDPANSNEVNKDMEPQDFPCDLFDYVFNVQAWEDNDGDYFCETAIQEPDIDNPPATINADEAFLKSEAFEITSCDEDTDFTDPTTKEPRGGLIWYSPDDGGCKPNFQVGTPTRPALLVVDKDLHVGAGFRMFGLVFVRSTQSPLDPTTGGNATFNVNGRAVIYGAVIVQGEVPHANGSGAIVYSKDVLDALANSPDFNRSASIPGSWTDRYTY
ncbi:MAG TPA: hypothetical protein VFO79_17245 [Xanthomonadales bacterium]|nr:hypothetical protein [Xanthomonadales bacterium]